MYTDSRVKAPAVEVWFYAFGTSRGGNWCSEPKLHPRTKTFKLRMPSDRFAQFVERRQQIAKALPTEDNKRFARALHFLLRGGGLAFYRRIQPRAEFGL